MRSFVSKNSLAKCQSFPLCLVISQATAERLEKKRVHSTRKLVSL
jgi:hypothetical protein